jgi:HK97 family phage prohead protease
MPYYITQNNPDCFGWSVMDIEGKAFGCHQTKQDAIDQALAISLAEDVAFLGERAMPDLSAPQFMSDAASQGVQWFEDGLAGDGVTAQTVREARLMASGEVSLDKWRRVSAWIARHLVDLDAPDADPESENYPSRGVVAHALWGSIGGKDGALLVKDYADQLLMQVDEESRALDAPPIKISDIDGTLIQDGERVEAVWSYLEGVDAPLFIVTGRYETEREATVTQLEDLGITYEVLLMNPGEMTSLESKQMAAEALLEEWNVLVAVENDAATREMYNSLGVEAVNPAELVSDGKMEAMSTNNTKREVERRLVVKDFEVREVADGMQLTGYAARFNEPSEPLPFIERIAPGAFRKSLQSRNDIKLLWNHDTSTVLGSTRANTLKLIEDDFGLRVEALLPDTTAGRDAKVLIQRGDVTGFSFGFTVPPRGDSWNAEGTERTLKSVRLHEVSVGVAFPAYTATNGTAQVRSLDRLAERAGVDADALADALTKVEQGEDITADDRALLSMVIDKLSTEPVEELNVGMLALKKKKLELLKVL